MPAKLETTINNISSIPNATNAALVHDFSSYMSSNGISENYQNGNIKIMIYFGRFLGADTCFYSLNKKEQVLDFPNTRIKDNESDPDQRWARTWNDYLQRIKYFIRWLYNQKDKEDKGEEPSPEVRMVNPWLRQNPGKENKTH